MNHVHNVTSLTCGASVEKNWGKEVLSAAGSFVTLLHLTVQINEKAKRTTGKKVTWYSVGKVILFKIFTKLKILNFSDEIVKIYVSASIPKKS